MARRRLTEHFRFESSCVRCLLADDKKDRKKEKKPLEAAPPSHIGRRKKPKGTMGASKLPNGVAWLPNT